MFQIGSPVFFRSSLFIAILILTVNLLLLSKSAFTFVAVYADYLMYPRARNLSLSFLSSSLSLVGVSDSGSSRLIFSS